MEAETKSFGPSREPWGTPGPILVWRTNSKDGDEQHVQTFGVNDWGFLAVWRNALYVVFPTNIHRTTNVFILWRTGQESEHFSFFLSSNIVSIIPVLKRSVNASLCWFVYHRSSLDEWWDVHLVLHLPLCPPFSGSRFTSSHLSRGDDRPTVKH